MAHKLLFNFFLFILVSIACMGIVSAELTNYDFESGLTDWTLDQSNAQAGGFGFQSIEAGDGSHYIKMGALASDTTDSEIALIQSNIDFSSSQAINIELGTFTEVGPYSEIWITCYDSTNNNEVTQKFIYPMDRSTNDGYWHVKSYRLSTTTRNNADSLKLSVVALGTSYTTEATAIIDYITIGGAYTPAPSFQISKDEYTSIEDVVIEYDTLVPAVITIYYDEIEIETYYLDNDGMPHTINHAQPEGTDIGEHLVKMWDPTSDQVYGTQYYEVTEGVEEVFYVRARNPPVSINDRLYIDYVATEDSDIRLLNPSMNTIMTWDALTEDGELNQLAYDFVEEDVTGVYAVQMYDPVTSTQLDEHIFTVSSFVEPYLVLHNSPVNKINGTLRIGYLTHEISTISMYKNSLVLNQWEEPIVDSDGAYHEIFFPINNELEVGIYFVKLYDSNTDEVYDTQSFMVVLGEGPEPPVDPETPDYIQDGLLGSSMGLINFMSTISFWGFIIWMGLTISIAQAAGDKINTKNLVLFSVLVANLLAVVGLWDPYTWYVLVISWIILAISFIQVGRKFSGTGED